MANAFRRAMGLPEDTSVEKPPTPKEPSNTHYDEEEEFCEITNKHGLKETGFWSNGHWFPICSQCNCHTMENRGQGTMCDNCQYDAVAHAVHY